MSAFWIGVWASVIGAVVGSGVIGGVVVFVQTRSTNRAAEAQAALMRSSVGAWAVAARDWTAAYRYHLVLAELSAAMAAVQETAFRQRRAPREAAMFAPVRRAAHERVMRYIVGEHTLLVAALPQPQRAWLEGIVDDLSDEFELPADSSPEDVNRLVAQLDEDLSWLRWAQDVLITVMTGTARYPRDPLGMVYEERAGVGSSGSIGQGAVKA